MTREPLVSYSLIFSNSIILWPLTVPGSHPSDTDTFCILQEQRSRLLCIILIPLFPQKKKSNRRIERIYSSALFFFFGNLSLSMKIRPQGLAPRDVKVPWAPASAEAYRLCQPMHVLSFGEGRKRFGLVYFLILMIFYYHILKATMDIDLQS